MAANAQRKAGDLVSNILAVTYDSARAITPANGTIFDQPFAGLLVTATGTLKFTSANGDDVTLSSTTVGQIIPIATTRVYSTGTSASVMGLVAPPYKGGQT
jgi:hypothetical protein